METPSETIGDTDGTVAIGETKESDAYLIAFTCAVCDSRFLLLHLFFVLVAPREIR